MKTVLRGVIAVALVAAFAYVLPAGALPGGTENYNIPHKLVRACTDSTTGTTDEERTITYAGPIAMWPPNHKYLEASVTAASEHAETDIKLDTAAHHDQYDGAGNESNGAGNTINDITPAAAHAENGGGNTPVTIDFKMRSERAGTIRGERVYYIDATATFSNQTCDTETFTICVPHDMRAATRKTTCETQLPA